MFADDDGGDTWNIKSNGASTKRMRRSTGGASFDFTSEHERNIRLSMDKFKEMSSDDKLESIFECLQTMKISNDCRLDRVEQGMRSLQKQTSVTHEQLKILQYKSVDIEARSRRSNLLIRVIAENLGEDCVAVVHSFFSEDLDLDPESIYIHRAHRVGSPPTRRPNQPLRHRPMIVALRDYQDVELILANAYKLRNTGFGINRDLPKEILDARKPLWSKLKLEKQQNPGAKLNIVYPAKLLRDGQVIADAFPDWHYILHKSRMNFDVTCTETSEDPAQRHDMQSQVVHPDPEDNQAINMETMPLYPEEVGSSTCSFPVQHSGQEPPKESQSSPRPNRNADRDISSLVQRPWVNKSNNVPPRASGTDSAKPNSESLERVEPVPSRVPASSRSDFVPEVASKKDKT